MPSPGCKEWAPSTAPSLEGKGTMLRWLASGTTAATTEALLLPLPKRY